jgi:diaminopimelate decarboxylase
LSRGLSGPLEIGDFLEYSNLGSYSVVMKPPFILPNVPILQRSPDGCEFAVIKRAETSDDIFGTFEVI